MDSHPFPRSKYLFSFYSWGGWGPIILLALITFVCYANSLQNGFVIDDHIIIETNHDSFGLKTVLTSFVNVDHLFENDTLPYYRQLTRASFLLDASLFGDNPIGFHAVNISLHILCTVLIYFTLLRLGHRQAVSLCAALLFGIHPINSETVNFISSRNNILAAIFVLLSFLSFLSSEKNLRKSGFFLSAVFFFLAMLSKETGAMLLPFLIVYKTYQQLKKHEARNPVKWDMSYIFYHVLFLAAYLFLRYIAIEDNYIYAHMSGIGARLKQLLYIIPSYFSWLIAPVKITWRHYMPTDFSGLIIPLTLWWSALIILFCIMFMTNKNGKLWIAWSIINFIPISNFVPIPSLPMAERYLYLPVIGIFVLIIEMMYSSAERIGIKKMHLIIFTCFILIFGIRTFYRNFDWRDDQRLARSAVKANPASAGNHFYLGLVLYHEGRTQESWKEFAEALALDPAFISASWAHYYLGAISIETHCFNKGKRFFMNSANLGNTAAKYILSLFFREKQKIDNRQARGIALPLITMNAIPLIPEASEGMSRLDPVSRPSIENIRSEHQPFSGNGIIHTEKWKLFYRYSNGTEMYYDAEAVRKKGNDITISTRYFLARSDRVNLALKIIKFPLTRAVETRFIINVNCPQRVYMTNYMEFRDDHGIVLGKICLEKEEPIMSEYLFPGTAMRSLTDAICQEQFH